MTARPAGFALAALTVLLTGCATAAPRAPAAPQAITLPSISYTISRSGPADGAQPTRKDTVLVNYDVKLTDGTLVDSSYARGEPSRFPLAKLIPAWQVIVPMMRPGDDWTVIVPSQFAYGSKDRDKIPPNSTLVFRIELLSFETAAE